MNQKLCIRDRIITLLLIGLSIIPSCKNEVVQEVSFPMEEEMLSDSLIVPPVIFASNPGLIITGEHLVLIENKAEKLFSIFRLPECNYVGGFGVLGRGPEEFNQINPYSHSFSVRL